MARTWSPELPTNYDDSALNLESRESESFGRTAVECTVIPEAIQNFLQTKSVWCELSRDVQDPIVLKAWKAWVSFVLIWPKLGWTLLQTSGATKSMKKLVLAIVLIASPAWAQTKLTPRRATARVDDCAPIGRTADGQLIYSLKCDNLPAPPAPPPLTEVEPPPEPAVQRSGLFGMSYEPSGTAPPSAPAGQ
jgi:hypothetical protein